MTSTWAWLPLVVIAVVLGLLIRRYGLPPWWMGGKGDGSGGE